MDIHCYRFPSFSNYSMYRKTYLVINWNRRNEIHKNQLLVRMVQTIITLPCYSMLTRLRNVEQFYRYVGNYLYEWSVMFEESNILFMIDHIGKCLHQ